MSLFSGGLLFHKRRKLERQFFPVLIFQENLPMALLKRGVQKHERLTGDVSAKVIVNEELDLSCRASSLSSLRSPGGWEFSVDAGTRECPATTEVLQVCGISKP